MARLLPSLLGTRVESAEPWELVEETESLRSVIILLYKFGLFLKS